MIEIRVLPWPQAVKAFVTFPFSLYRNDPYWVPPLLSDEMAHLDPRRNPVFKQVKTRFIMAYRDGQPVGRMAGIINQVEVAQLGKKQLRFGWWDVQDEVQITKALLDDIMDWGRREGMAYIEGPMGFSNLDKVGVVTEGFDYRGSMITWYNKPYYASHLEALGFTVEKRYRECEFVMDHVQTEGFSRGQALVKARYGVKPLNFTRTSELLPYVDVIFELFNQTYAALPSFVPIQPDQIAYFKQKYIPLINPEFIKLVTDAHDKPIAFSIVMPSFSAALQKAQGKLWPWGWYHLLRAKKHNDEVLFYLIGIAPEYQNKGITAVIFDEYYKTFSRYGIRKFVRTPELEDNKAIDLIWKHFGAEVKRKRCTYLKAL